MKKFYMTSAAALLGMIVLSAGAAAMTGSGSPEDPYTVADASDFSAFAAAVAAGNATGNYVQTADIDFASASVKPIGTETAPFSGTYDGAGYTLSSFSSPVASSSSGVFGFLKDAYVHDLHVSGVTINGTVSFGGIAATVQGTGVIENCTVDMTLKASTSSTPLYACGGGIAGKVGEEAKIVGCETNVTMTTIGTTYTPFIFCVGGIAGENKGTVDKCTANGAMTAVSKTFLVCVGGIVGENLGAVSGCVSNTAMKATVSVESAYAYLGGIVGYNNGGTITRTVNYGTVTGNGKSPYPCYVGGITGYNSNGTVSISKNSAEMAGTASLGGGIAGVNFGYEGAANIENCLSVGNISMSSSVSGGLVGDNATSAHSDSAVSLVSSLYTGSKAIVGLEEQSDGTSYTVEAAYATDMLGETLRNVSSYAGFENEAWIFRGDIGRLPELFVVMDEEKPELRIAGTGKDKVMFAAYAPDGDLAGTDLVVIAFYKENRLTGAKVVSVSDIEGIAAKSSAVASGEYDNIKLLPFASLETLKPSALGVVSDAD